MYIFKECKKECFDIYLNKEFKLNEYNEKTKNNLVNIYDGIKKGFFEVPYYVRDTKWGEEIVFFPFTNKLFKIVKTTKNDTSIQLHPRKSEIWYPLIKSTIFNGIRWIDVNNNKRVVIPKNSIHCMKYNSCVFEVQDNSFFDSNETIRIFDVNKREINDKNEYLNYVLNHNKNILNIEKTDKKTLINNSDIFLFIISGKNMFENMLLSSNKLYYIKKNKIIFLNLKGNYICISASYITYSEYEFN